MPDNTNDESIKNDVFSQPKNPTDEIILNEVTDPVIENHETENIEVHHHPQVGKKISKDIFWNS